jgi:hypothetical protein
MLNIIVGIVQKRDTPDIFKSGARVEKLSWVFIEPA